MDRAEHNIKCDADAARVVFGSGVPMTVISLDLTIRVWLFKNDLPQIAALANGLGPLLENQLIRWWEYRQVEGSNSQKISKRLEAKVETLNFEL